MLAHRAVDGESYPEHVVRATARLYGDELDPLHFAHVLAGKPHPGAFEQAVGGGHKRYELIAFAEDRCCLTDEEDPDAKDRQGYGDREPHSHLAPGDPRRAVHISAYPCWLPPMNSCTYGSSDVFISSGVP